MDAVSHFSTHPEREKCMPCNKPCNGGEFLCYSNLPTRFVVSELLRSFVVQSYLSQVAVLLLISGLGLALTSSAALCQK